MISKNLLIIALPAVVIFGIVLWIMIFLNTYRHFPKMNPSERFVLCIRNATGLTIIIIVIIYVFLWFVLKKFVS